MRSRFRAVGPWIAVAAILAGCCCRPRCDRPCSPCGAPVVAQASLFDRIGGMKGLEAIVDDFFPRIMSDKRVMGNAAVGAKMQAADPKAVRQRTIDKICQLAGGPCAYTGRDMKTAHHGLGITKAEWDAAGQDFLAALEHQHVGEREKAELMAAIGGLEKDVVEKP